MTTLDLKIVLLTRPPAQWVCTVQLNEHSFLRPLTWKNKMTLESALFSFIWFNFSTNVVLHNFKIFFFTHTGNAEGDAVL